MAGQGLFSRAFSILGTNRIFLTNRVNNVNYQPSAGLKKAAKELLKQLNVPEKPKRPASAYIRFLQDQRPAILKSHPDWGIGEVTRKCASDWKAASASIKEKYEAQFKADKEVYSVNYKKYLESLTDDMKVALKDAQEEKKANHERLEIKKSNKLYNKPKRPHTGFIIYLLEQAKQKNKALKEVAKDSKGGWYLLTEAEKEHYNNIFQKNKVQYEKDLLEWEKKMLEQGHKELVRTKTIKTCPTSWLHNVKTE